MSNMVVVTAELMTAGSSVSGLWNRKQLELLGVPWPLEKGWRLLVLGNKITQEAADRFIALKNSHIRNPQQLTKPKQQLSVLYNNKSDAPEEIELVKITNDFINSGRSRNGGWSRAQFVLIGVSWPAAHGWKYRIIGKYISTEDARKFVELCGSHLKPKKTEISVSERVNTSEVCPLCGGCISQGNPPRT